MARAIPVDIGDEHFPTKEAARERCRDILHAYPGEPGSGPGQPQPVTDPVHVEFLTALVARHKWAGDKIGAGVAGFKVQVNAKGTGGTRCFYVVHPDGNSTQFSFDNCL